MSKISYIDYISTLLPEEELESFKSCYSERLAKTIKIVLSKISIQDFQKLVGDMGWVLRPSPNPDCFYVDKFTGSKTLGQHFLHQGGFYYIQELSASMSAPVLEAKPGELILDLCAAPGGKTVQIADTGSFVIANEPLNPRRKALIYNLNRTGMINSAITNYDGTRFGALYPEFFDKVLVDAPCSGEGMSYKTGGTMSWNEGLVKSLSRIQFDLLSSAIDSCKLGGTVVYSTCTLNEIENEGVISNILNKYSSSIELVFSKKYRPHRDKCGGFFVSKINKLSRNQQTSKPTSNKPQQNKSIFDMSAGLQKTIKTQLESDFGIVGLDPNILFFSSTQSIYITKKDVLGLNNEISLDKLGVPIYDLSRDGRYIPSHFLGNILGSYANRNFIEISDDQAQSFSSGLDLKLVGSSGVYSGFVVLKWKNYGFSLGKIVGEIIKNKMI